MLDIIKKRRSTRQFTNEAVSDEDINTLLLSALLAPTSRSFDSLEFVVVQDKASIAALKKCKAHGASPLVSSPLVIAVLGNTKETDVWIEDASIATISLQYNAEAMGLGSTWIQMRLRQDESGNSAETRVREVLNLPGHYAVPCLIAIGHKAETKKAYEDKDAKFQFVHKEKFGTRLVP